MLIFSRFQLFSAQTGAQHLSDFDWLQHLTSFGFAADMSNGSHGSLQRILAASAEIDAHKHS